MSYRNTQRIEIKNQSIELELSAFQNGMCFSDRWRVTSMMTLCAYVPIMIIYGNKISSKSVNAFSNESQSNTYGDFLRPRYGLVMQSPSNWVWSDERNASDFLFCNHFSGFWFLKNRKVPRELIHVKKFLRDYKIYQRKKFQRSSSIHSWPMIFKNLRISSQTRS